MTDLEKEMMRQIHELDKEMKQLRERVAVLESRLVAPVTVQPAPPMWVQPMHPGTGTPPSTPPYQVTCGGAT